MGIGIGVGLLVGLVMGALGGGGGIIAVPALVHLLGMPTSAATTTSLVIVGITSVAAVVQHAQSGHVDWVDGWAFGLLSALGALAGARLGALAGDDLTLGLFSGLLLVVGAVMWHRSRGGGPTSADAPPRWLTRNPWRIDPARAARVVLVATCCGLLTGFFGVGGGFAVVPALVLLLGLPMSSAVGTSLLVMVIASVAALAGRRGSAPDLDVHLIAVVTAAAILGSLLGGRLGARVRPARLQAAFAVLLVVVALYSGVATLLS